MSYSMITGSMVALVTPMLPDGSLDMPGFKQLVDWHIQEGTSALIIAGTTGESATITVDEQALLIRTAVEHAKGRIKIIAGTGGNSTHEAIALTKLAKEAGADAGLSVVPYYNKPTQEGLYQHFKAIATSVDLPLILYNVPGRTVADLSNETVARLAQLPNIVGIKDATGDIGRGTALLRLVPASFAVYSGDDATAPALMLLGGKGNISVTANVAPGAMAQLCKAAIAGDAATTRKINDQLIPLHKNLFLEANPIPVKWALTQMGRIQPGQRLPLTPLSAAHHAAVLEALRVGGIAVAAVASAA